MRRCLGKVGGLGIEEQRERSFADSRRYGYCPSDSHRLPHAQVCMGVYNGTGICPKQAVLREPSKCKYAEDGSQNGFSLPPRDPAVLLPSLRPRLRLHQFEIQLREYASIVQAYKATAGIPIYTSDKRPHEDNNTPPRIRRRISDSMDTD